MNRVMSPVRWDECNNKIHYFEMFLKESKKQESVSQGLGDTIAKMTKAIGIKPCGGCKDRQEKLNKLFPYKGGATNKPSKRLKPKKFPPHVTFLTDAKGRPADCLHDLFPGGTCFLLCGGPSLREMPIDELARPGILTASLNNAPTAFASHTHDPRHMIRPNLWFCVDFPGTFHESTIRDPAVMKFVMEKYKSQNAKLTRHDGKHHYWSKDHIQEMPNIWFYDHCKEWKPNEFLTQPKPTWVRNPNRCVMFPTLRILFFLGIRRLYLLGCDFKQRPGTDSYSFDDPMTKQRAAFNNGKFERLDEMLCELRPHFEEYGYQVLNCTPGSRLTAFDHVDFTLAIEDAISGMPAEIHTRGMYLKKPSKAKG